jgi:hypothetical protein
MDDAVRFDPLARRIAAPMPAHLDLADVGYLDAAAAGVGAGQVDAPSPMFVHERQRADPLLVRRREERDEWKVGAARELHRDHCAIRAALDEPRATRPRVAVGALAVERLRRGDRLRSVGPVAPGLPDLGLDVAARPL